MQVQEKKKAPPLKLFSGRNVSDDYFAGARPEGKRSSKAPTKSRGSTSRALRSPTPSDDSESESEEEEDDDGQEYVEPRARRARSHSPPREKPKAPSKAPLKAPS